MILSWNAKTSFSAILDNWEVPVCCWNTIGYSVCDLKRAEKTGPCWRKCIWKQFTENWFLPGSAFHKELVQYPWKSAPREEIMSTTWISKKLALPALTSKHCQCNLYQFSQYFNKSIRRFTYWCPIKLQPSITFALQPFQIHPEARHWSIQTLQCNNYCPF